MLYIPRLIMIPDRLECCNTPTLHQRFRLLRQYSWCPADIYCHSFHLLLTLRTVDEARPGSCQTTTWSSQSNDRKRTPIEAQTCRAKLQAALPVAPSSRPARRVLLEQGNCCNACVAPLYGQIKYNHQKDLCHATIEGTMGNDKLGTLLQQHDGNLTSKAKLGTAHVSIDV